VTEELIARANRLGSDPAHTNYAGGNTSAKGSALDPVTGQPTELLWVKGSGGDLGTLTEAGLAVPQLDRLRALVALRRRRSTPPCTGSSTRRTSTTCTRTPASHWPPPPTAPR
jgi:rhamnose utilization protein RhaD (predicted bifunctional aldolase and dehydrogenase)